VTGFTIDDITVGNGTKSNFVPVDANTYTFNVTPTADGAVIVNIAGGVAQDAATNSNSAATQFSITYNAATFTVTLDKNGGNTESSPNLISGITSGGTVTYHPPTRTGYTRGAEYARQ
jgi:hypothetical protein